MQFTSITVKPIYNQLFYLIHFLGWSPLACSYVIAEMRLKQFLMVCKPAQLQCDHKKVNKAQVYKLI